MPDERNPIARFTFRVEISGITESGFLSVSPLESFSTVIETRRGNDGEARKWPGAPRCSNIVMRRGYSGEPSLWTWLRSVLDGAFDRHDGSILLLAADRKEAARINFYQAWPCRWRLGPWDGGDEGALIEEIEIAVEKIEIAT